MNALRFLRPLFLMAGLLLAGWGLRHVPGLDPASLNRIVGHGWSGMAILVFGGAALCAVGVPRQAVAFAGAYSFGLLLGGLLSLLAQCLGCVACYGWARFVAHGWARDRTQAWLKRRMARADRILAAHPFTATLMLRLLPVGNNLVMTVLAGIAGLPAMPFLAASVIGYVPQTVVFALLGSGVRVQRGWQLGLGLALFLAAALCGVRLMRTLSRSGLNADAIADPVANPPG